MQTSEQHRRIIDRTLPLVEENTALRATVANLEAGIRQAQEAQDAAEARAADLEVNLGSLAERMASAAKEKKGNLFRRR